MVRSYMVATQRRYQAMPYDPDRHHRRTLRLQQLYSQTNTFFVTLTTHERVCLFGEVVGGAIVLSAFGKIVEEEWLKTPEIRPQAVLDAYVIMPNHAHLLVRLSVHADATGAVAVVGRDDRPLVRPARSLGSLIAGFKAACTTRINTMRDTAGARVWQRNYYERIVRNERELNALRCYIRENPSNWAADPDNV